MASIVQKFASKKSYEYLFNESQLRLKQQLVQEALLGLEKSVAAAAVAGEHDLARFKVQEFYLMSCLSKIFNHVEYAQHSTFDLPKSLKNHNLVEANLTALKETYELDALLFKETIGNLNWKKFAERLSQQLKDNTNLTCDQQTLLEINVIVALLHSHQFAQAKDELKRVRKHNPHPALKGIEAFFLLKDKKFEDASSLVANDTQAQSVFLNSHVLFAQKRNQDAIENLLKYVCSVRQTPLFQNEGFLIFLLKTALSNKLPFSAVEELVSAMTADTGACSTEGLLYLTDFLNEMGEQQRSNSVLAALIKQRGLGNKDLNARYLLALVCDRKLKDASSVLEQIGAPSLFGSFEKDEALFVSQLIEDAMPERRKEKKT